MPNPWLMLVIVVVGVPAALFGYIVLVETVLGALPDRQRTAARPWLWMAPAALLVLVFLLYPLLETVRLSFFNADSSAFVGLGNYVYAFTTQDVLIAIRNNIFWLVFFTALCVALGLITAVLFDRVRYESAAKAIVFLPGVISATAAAVIWKLMFEFRPAGLPQIGTINAFLDSLLPNFQPQAWLVNLATNNAALILAAVWTSTGFTMVILSAGLKSIPAEVLEAARVDGATERQIFWQVTIPMLGSTITVVTTLMILSALKVFDIIYVMTSGNYDTEVLATRMYRELFQFNNLGTASAISVILLLAVTPVMLRNIREFAQQEAMR